MRLTNYQCFTSVPWISINFNGLLMNFKRLIDYNERRHTWLCLTRLHEFQELLTGNQLSWINFDSFQRFQLASLNEAGLHWMPREFWWITTFQKKLQDLNLFGWTSIGFEWVHMISMNFIGRREISKMSSAQPNQTLGQMFGQALGHV